MKPKLNYIDMTKGIGMIAVVMLHSGLLNKQMIAIISAFIMPLFFMTSGMLMNYTEVIKKQPKVFYWNRIKSSLVPYVIFGILYMIMGVLRGYTSPELFKIFFENITLFGNSVLWFLPCLFMVQAIVYEIYRKLPQKKAGLCLLMISMFGYLGMKPLILGFPKDTLFMQGIYNILFACLRALFAAGYVALGYHLLFFFEYKKQRLHYIWENVIQVILGICFIVFWFVGALQNGETDFKIMALGNVWCYLGVSIAATVGLLLLCRCIKQEKILAYIGKYSMIIMLTHLDLQYLNVSIKCGELLEQHTGALGTILFWIGMICSMIILECVTIQICNHYFYFIFGKSQKESTNNAGRFG